SEDAAAAIAEAGRLLSPAKAGRGVELATEAGFDPQGRIARGRAWRAICDIALELVPEVIVLGARGLGRVEGALLGSVSSAVVVHAKHPVLVVPRHPET
ncbi:MAG: universal stress protein, partial [Solirubrobacteraceae bacterium]